MSRNRTNLLDSQSSQDEGLSEDTPLSQRLPLLEEALLKVKTQYEAIAAQQGSVTLTIHAAFRKLREALNDRETELIGQLDGIAQGKLKCLAAQREHIETTLTQPIGRRGEIALPDMLKPTAEADMIFSPSADIAPSCRSFRQVLTLCGPDPLRCYASCKGVEVAVVGVTSTATIQAVRYWGEPCEEPIKSLECVLVSKITVRSGCSVKRKGESQYKISYQPTIKGRHQLHIKVEGQHINGSPLSMAMKAPVKELGSPILTLYEVDEPWGVVINQRGEVIVSEWGSHCVSVFSPSGEKNSVIWQRRLWSGAVSASSWGSSGW